MTDDDNTPWEQQRKMTVHPSARVTPELSLLRTLEKARAGRIRSVYISIEWDNETVGADWSQMSRAMLCYHGVAIQRYIQQDLFPQDCAPAGPLDHSS